MTIWRWVAILVAFVAIGVFVYRMVRRQGSKSSEPHPNDIGTRFE